MIHLQGEGGAASWVIGCGETLPPGSSFVNKAVRRSGGQADRRNGNGVIASGPERSEGRVAISPPPRVYSGGLLRSFAPRNDSVFLTALPPLPPFPLAVLGTNRVGFTNKFGVGVQNRISVGDTNRVGFASKFGLGAHNGIPVRDPNRVGFTNELGVGTQDGIPERHPNRVRFASKVGLGPKSSGILGSSRGQV